MSLSAADVDGDGDLDLFVGGHLLPGNYPRHDQSFILVNDKGKFRDATEAICTTVRDAGLVKCSLWTDLNNDRKPDLVIAGEWMPILVLFNHH